MLVRESGFWARKVTARLPWEGWERMRAMPVPCVVLEMIRIRAFMVGKWIWRCT